MSSTTRRLPPTSAYPRLNARSRYTPLLLRWQEPRTAPTLARYRQVVRRHLHASPRVALTYQSNSPALACLPEKHSRTCYRFCTFFKFSLISLPAFPTAAMKRLFNLCRVPGELLTTASHQGNGIST